VANLSKLAAQYTWRHVGWLLTSSRQPTSDHLQPSKSIFVNTLYFSILLFPHKLSSLSFFFNPPYFLISSRSLFLSSSCLPSFLQKKKLSFSGYLSVAWKILSLSARGWKPPWHPALCLLLIYPRVTLISKALGSLNNFLSYNYLLKATRNLQLCSYLIWLTDVLNLDLDPLEYKPECR
jgi:hypothetical protein